jgi:hypothetical protein
VAPTSGPSSSSSPTSGTRANGADPDASEDAPAPSPVVQR